MSRRARKQGYPRREQRLPREVAEALLLVHVDEGLPIIIERDGSVRPFRPVPMSAAEVMAFMVAPDLADLPGRDPYVAAKRQRKLHQSSVEALRHEAEKRGPAPHLTTARERRLARRRVAREELSRQSA